MILRHHHLIKHNGNKEALIGSGSPHAGAGGPPNGDGEGMDYDEVESD